MHGRCMVCAPPRRAWHSASSRSPRSTRSCCGSTCTCSARRPLPTPAPTTTPTPAADKPKPNPSPSSSPISTQIPIITTPTQLTPHPKSGPKQLSPHLLRAQASLCNQLLPQMDGFVKAVVTLVPEVLGPAGQELEGPLKAESEKREEVRAALCLLSARVHSAWTLRAHRMHTARTLHCTPHACRTAPHVHRRCWWRC